MKNKILRTDRLLAALVAMLALFAAPQANAQTYTTNTYIGNGTAWTTTSGWSLGTAPASNTVVRFTNTTARNIGVNGNGASNNTTAGFLVLSNTTITITNSSVAASANNSNAVLRVFGWVEGGQTNLIVNSSTTGHLVFLQFRRKG